MGNCEADSCGAGTDSSHQIQSFKLMILKHDVVGTYCASLLNLDIIYISREFILNNVLRLNPSIKTGLYLVI